MCTSVRLLIHVSHHPQRLLLYTPLVGFISIRTPRMCRRVRRIALLEALAFDRAAGALWVRAGLVGGGVRGISAGPVVPAEGTGSEGCERRMRSVDRCREIEFEIEFERVLEN